LHLLLAFVVGILNYLSFGDAVNFAVFDLGLPERSKIAEVGTGDHATILVN
jgi:hypothetical protein